MRMPDSVNDREVVRCIRFRRFKKNTLLAFVDLELVQTGLIIRDCCCMSSGA
jgi:hypothetical protein